MLLFIKNHCYQKSKGYHFIEVLLALLLLSILASWAIPTFRDRILKQYQEADIQQLVSVIDFARLQALLLNTDFLLCPVSHSSQQCGEYWEQGYVLWQCNEAQCLQRRSFHFFDSTALLTSSRPHVVFSPTGLSRGTNLGFQYRSRSSSFAVNLIVNLQGRIRVEKIS